MNPKVSVNILNWNRAQDTIECVESCQKIRYDRYEILIIDNHSTDNSVQIFRKHFPRVSIIQNNDNLGYAGGNNVGIRHALAEGADYVLILNNDTVVEPDVLEKLVHAMKNNQAAGIAAPKVLYYDDRKTINSLGTFTNWLRLRPYLGHCNQPDNSGFPEVMKKDILVGCALLVSKETIKRIGLLDENFFLLHEEADWCYRNLKSSFENIVVPGTVIYHKVSQTTKGFPESTHYYSNRNFLYMAHRNASAGNLVKVYIGLCYLILKHTVLSLSFHETNRKTAQAFFFGVYDFFSRKMGKCQRTL